MYQVCTCPNATSTAGDPNCPVHGKPPEYRITSWCSECAALRGEVERLSAEVMRLQDELADARDTGYKAKYDRYREAVEWALGTVPVELIDNVEGWDIFNAFRAWQDELRRRAGEG